MGRTLVTRGHAFRVVGVMPADFDYPPGVDVWTTLAALAQGEAIEAYRIGLLRDVELIARLRPGVTPQQAEAELANLMARLDAEAPGATAAASLAFGRWCARTKTSSSATSTPRSRCCSRRLV